jgi:hypothetical protein
MKLPQLKCFLRVVCQGKGKHNIISASGHCKPRVSPSSKSLTVFALAAFCMLYSPSSPSKSSACLNFDEVPNNQVFERGHENYLDWRQGEQEVYFLNMALREFPSALS